MTHAIVATFFFVRNKSSVFPEPPIFSRKFIFSFHYFIKIKSSGAQVTHSVKNGLGGGQSKLKNKLVIGSESVSSFLMNWYDMSTRLAHI